ALEHLLHRLGPELIRVLLAAHEHLCCSQELWPAGVYERLGGPYQCPACGEISKLSDARSDTKSKLLARIQN
ncbi:MAG: hypothetical protein KA738_11585, partial [Pseudoxanthomonas sp.]|nr:hypothetical protein [Pseudoxanthomonas sp.]